jgi:hypothetical protein
VKRLLLLPIAVLVGLLLTANPLSASCAANPDEPYPRLARIEVDSCVSASEYADTILGDLQVPWLYLWFQRRVANEPGIVVSGTVVEGFAFTGWTDEGIRIGEHLTGTFKGRWFYPTEQADLCEEWASTTIVLTLGAICCDILPPSQLPCFLSVGAAEAVPPELENLLQP